MCGVELIMFGLCVCVCDCLCVGLCRDCTVLCVDVFVAFVCAFALSV